MKASLKYAGADVVTVILYSNILIRGTNTFSPLIPSRVYLRSEVVRKLMLDVLLKQKLGAWGNPFLSMEQLHPVLKVWDATQVHLDVLLAYKTHGCLCPSADGLYLNEDLHYMEDAI